LITSITDHELGPDVELAVLEVSSTREWLEASQRLHRSGPPIRLFLDLTGSGSSRVLAAADIPSRQLPGSPVRYEPVPPQHVRSGRMIVAAA